MVLTVSFVLSLVIGLCCHHRPAEILQALTPASRRQDHTTSPSAAGTARLAALKRPPHPAPNAGDDRPNAPLGRARDGNRDIAASTSPSSPISENPKLDASAIAGFASAL